MRYLKLIGFHLTSAEDYEMVYEKFKYLIDNNADDIDGVSKLNAYIIGILYNTYVDVEKVRVFDGESFSIYDISMAEYMRVSSSMTPLKILDNNGKYKISLSSDVNNTSVILLVYWNNKVLFDLSKFGGSNIINLSGWGMGRLEFYIDAISKDLYIGIDYDEITCDFRLVDSYMNGRLIRMRYRELYGEEPLSLMFSGISRQYGDGLLIFFEKIALLSLSNVGSNSIIIPSGVKKLILINELKNHITLVIPPSVEKVVGTSSTVDEGFISYIISKSASLGVIRGITEFGVNNICWYLSRDIDDTNAILDIIREKSKVKIEMY